MEDLFFSENIFIIWETSSGNMNSMRKKLASIQMDNNSTISTSDKTIYMKINSSPYSVINNSNLKIFSAPEQIYTVYGYLFVLIFKCFISTCKYL